MQDIIDIKDGEDLIIRDSPLMKAGNVLSVQIGELSFKDDFGIDLKFFLSSPLVFQNESFRTYLIERLSLYNINVAEVLESFQSLFETYTFSVGNEQDNLQGYIK